MKISIEFIENHGFKKVNNSTWRCENCTLQSKFFTEAANIYEIAEKPIERVFKGCSDGKSKMMICTEDDFYIFMGAYGANG